MKHIITALTYQSYGAQDKHLSHVICDVLNSIGPNLEDNIFRQNLGYLVYALQL